MSGSGTGTQSGSKNSMRMNQAYIKCKNLFSVLITHVDPHRTAKNVGDVLKGYDIMMGNPLNFLKGKYAEDEGFKNNIFKANSTNKVKEITS